MCTVFGWAMLSVFGAKWRICMPFDDESSLRSGYPEETIKLGNPDVKGLVTKIVEIDHGAGCNTRPESTSDDNVRSRATLPFTMT